MKKEPKKQRRLSGKIAFEMGEVAGFALVAFIAICIGGIVLFINFRQTPAMEEVVLATPANTEPINLIESDAIRHTLGTGEITWIQYADLECPVCKRFYPTATSVRDQVTDRLSYTFKHFPSGAYKRSFTEAEATECVGEQNEQAFFRLVDRIYETTPSKDGLTDEALVALVKETGIDMTAFTACWEEGRYTNTVLHDVEEAKAAGGAGTPFNIFTDADGTIIATVAGSVNEEQLLETINGLLD